MIYQYKNGQRYIALSDESIKDLDWDPKQLLELDHDGIGWIIRQATCNTVRFLKNGHKTDKIR